MTTTNEHTGDKLKSKPSTDKFRDNFDKIFGTGKKKVKPTSNSGNR